MFSFLLLLGANTPLHATPELVLETPQQAHIAPVVTAAPKVWSTEELKALARSVAEKRGLNVPRFIDVINCENPNWNPAEQSGYYKNGVREDSWGLAQIHLPSHPEITKAQATDPEWSLNWMADAWKGGRASQWSCYIRKPA